MKKMLLILVMVVFLGLLLVGCWKSSAPRGNMIVRGDIVEVLMDVYDDEQSTVYIRVGKAKIGEEDASIAEIMAKKSSWERKFPNKKVVAMSIVTGSVGNYGYPVVIGLLIHYERR